MSYAGSKEDIMMPIISIVVRQSYYVMPAMVYTLTLLKPCVDILVTSLLLPCSSNGLMIVRERDGFRNWIHHGTTLVLGAFEHLFVRQLVAIGILVNYTGEFL